MDRRFLVDTSSVIENKQTWDAFLAIVAYYEKKTIDKLQGKQSPEELIRINAEYNLLQTLKKTRENALNAKHEFNSASN